MSPSSDKPSSAAASSPWRFISLAMFVTACITGMIVLILVTMSVTGSEHPGTMSLPMLIATFVNAAMCLALLLTGTLLHARSTTSSPQRPRTSEGGEEYLSVIETLTEGVMTTDPDGTILTVNEGLATMLGYDVDDLLAKKPGLMRSEHHDEAFYAAMWKAIESKGRWEGKITNRRKDGEAIAMRLAISAIRDEAGAIVKYVAVYEAVDNIDDLDQTIPRSSHHDALTGLPDRSLFTDRLAMAIDHAERNDEKLGVIFLDLTRFGHINETLGYLVGDQLLTKTAETIGQCLAGKDTVARWRGPVFAFLIPEIDKPEAAATVARRLLEKLSVPMTVFDHKVYSAPSLGIAVYPEDGTDAQVLIKSANVALASASEKGKNKLRFYTLDFEKGASERLGLEAELSRAAKLGEFELHYQPQVRISTGKLIGAEALIRWRHPSRGLVSPGVFIPIAEETGLIHEISEWTMWTGCEQWKRWTTDEKVTDARLALNISPIQFRQDSFLDKVQEVLEGLKLNPKLLELEITESVLMKGARNTIEKIEALQDWGIHISMDDFGTGYSSLSYLTRFRVDCLKIDRQFVKSIPENQDNVAITTAIIAMAHSLDISIIAEGVEKSRQVQFLTKHGCDLLQGYLFSRPVPPSEFLKIKDKNPPWL